METTRRSRPTARWIGASAIIATIVVQLGLATMPLWPVGRVGVDPGDDQRHVLVHAPVAGVVDDYRAGLDQPRRPLGADRAAGRGEDDVEALDRLRAQRPALQRRPVPLDSRPAERSEQTALPRRPGNPARRAPRGWSSRRRRWRPALLPGSLLMTRSLGGALCRLDPRAAPRRRRARRPGAGPAPRRARGRPR